MLVSELIHLAYYQVPDSSVHHGTRSIPTKQAQLEYSICLLSPFHVVDYPQSLLYLASSGYYS